MALLLARAQLSGLCGDPPRANRLHPRAPAHPPVTRLAQLVMGDGGAQGNAVPSEPVADALQIDEEEIDGDWAESTVELAKEDSDGSPDHYLSRRVRKEGAT